VLAGCPILPGNWRPGWNQPWSTPGTHPPDTAASWKIGEPEKQDGRFLAMAISGGGSRAANFGAAVMLELQRRDLLTQVDVMSGVSGGTLPIAYYGLGPEKAGPFTEDALRKAFGYDFQSSWIRRWFLPQNFFRYWFTDFTRSDIMVQIFNNRLYHKSTFGDLRRRPKILINATARNNHIRFTFTDQWFEAHRSSLAGYQVANAVNASSAFPGAFDDVTLENYTDPASYLHLYDGGPMDNLGVQALLQFLNGISIGRQMDADFPNGCLILIVDATPSTDNELISSKKSDRSFVDHFINTNALDSVDTMLSAARTNLLTNLGIKPIDQEVRGEAHLPDLDRCRCRVAHIALRHLQYTGKNDALAKRVTRIGTKFWVSPEEQADLFEAAKLLIEDLDDSHLLPDASMKTQCGRPAKAS
jgi:NTE family protein